MRSFITLYASPNIIRVMKVRRIRWAGHVTHMGKMRNVYCILVEKPEEKRPFEITRCSWESNIRKDFRKVGWEGVDCIHLALNRDLWRALVNTVMNIRVP
jgi:hypothetical protein